MARSLLHLDGLPDFWLPHRRIGSVVAERGETGAKMLGLATVRSVDLQENLCDLMSLSSMFKSPFYAVEGLGIQDGHPALGCLKHLGQQSEQREWGVVTWS